MELNTHTAAYYREKEYKAFSAIPGMNAFLSASSEAERMELEKTYPDAAFALMISGNLVGRDREQCEIHQKAYYGVLDEKLEAYVEINDMRYGLLREKVPDTDDSYYYFPGFILYGTVQSIGSESKQLYFQSDESYPLVALNAVDGTATP